MKLHRFAAPALFTAMLVIGLNLNAFADDCTQTLQATVNPIGGSGLQGTAQICIQGNTTSVVMKTGGLIAGDAYTIWFVYFDDPTLCGSYPNGTPGVCTGADTVFPPNNPVGVFGRMDGVIAEASGSARLTGHFRGFQFSHSSIIWLLMFEHGPANTTDNRYLARQLLTPQKPALGPPGLGAPTDGAVGTPVAVAKFNVP